jgi:glycosyltransferase involved in cell wall biosynthesis
LSVRHVVIVNDSACIDGGAAKIAVDSALELARRGMKISFVSAIGPIDPALRDSGAEIVHLGQTPLIHHPSRAVAAMRGLWNERARNALDDVLAGCNPAETIVHFHLWLQLSPSVFAARRLKHFSCVVTHHAYFATCPNGGYLNYRTSTICPYTPLSQHCIMSHCDQKSRVHKGWRLARQVIQNSVFHSPRRLNSIFVSQFSAKVLLQHLQHSKNSTVIGNPITVDKAERVRAEDNRNYMFVGRLEPEKGVLLLAHVARDLQLPLIFIGDGKQRGEAAVVCPHAEFTGWLPFDDVIARLQTARALVFPSVWYETQGLVLLEAAALGIPAVVGDGGAGRDAVEDRHTGLWFSHGDRGDLARALKELDSNALVEQLSKAAYKRFWTDPPLIGGHVDALMAYYEQVKAS